MLAVHENGRCWRHRLLIIGLLIIVLIAVLIILLPVGRGGILVHGLVVRRFRRPYRLLGLRELHAAYGAELCAVRIK